MEAFGEQVSEVTGDFYAAERAGWFVPGADPVDGSGHGEGGELGVAGGDGFVCDSLFDVAANGGVDAPLEGSYFFAGFGGKLVFVEHGDTAAEVIENDGLCVGFDVGFDFGETGPATDEGLVEKGFDEGDAGSVALHQDLFFVAKVVVEGGLCDLQPLCQLAHRGAAIALLKKHVRGSLQNGVALDVLIALTGLKGFPGFVSALGCFFHDLIVSGLGRVWGRKLFTN